VRGGRRSAAAAGVLSTSGSFAMIWRRLPGSKGSSGSRRPHDADADDCGAPDPGPVLGTTRPSIRSVMESGAARSHDRMPDAKTV
jgi:hypothetical protein